jgi:hypothetical protein
MSYGNLNFSYGGNIWRIYILLSLDQFWNIHLWYRISRGKFTLIDKGNNWKRFLLLHVWHDNQHGIHNQVIIVIDCGPIIVKMFCTFWNNLQFAFRSYIIYMYISKRKYKQQLWATIPQISTKRTITLHFKWWNKKKTTIKNIRRSRLLLGTNTNLYYKWICSFRLINSPLYIIIAFIKENVLSCKTCIRTFKL